MSHDSDPVTPAGPTTATEDAFLWLHSAFCRVALPLRAPRAAWTRRVGSVSVRLEPGAAGAALPNGVFLRQMMLHICDTAWRSRNPVVPLGETATELAARLGLDSKAGLMSEQVERVLGAKLFISLDSTPELSVFDARSRPRGPGGAWRSSLRLNAGFFASLVEQAVPLERRILALLAPNPGAIDAYAWIRHALLGQPPTHTVTASWEDLLARFGTGTQDVNAFRPVFEQALRHVFDADLSLSIAVDDEGVSARAAEAEAAVPASVQPEIAVALAAPVAALPPPVVPEPILAPVARPQAPAAPTPVQDTISLRSQITGLSQVIWLRRGHGQDSALVGVTPSARFDADRLTVLAVEPMVMQVSGGLNAQDFERVSAWVMANRDLIDGFWEGAITTAEEIDQRVRKVPAVGWR